MVDRLEARMSRPGPFGIDDIWDEAVEAAAEQAERAGTEIDAAFAVAGAAIAQRIRTLKRKP